MSYKKQIKIISLIVIAIIPYALTAQTMMNSNTFELDQEGQFSIKIDVPTSWRVFTREGGIELLFLDQTYDIRMLPPSNVKALLTITVGRTTTNGQLPNDQFQRLISSRVLPLLPNAVEDRVALYQFDINGGYNTYCILTDATLVNKPPIPNEYKYVGLYFANYENGCIVYGTLLTDDIEDEHFNLMLRSVSSILPLFGN
jgi:hypothetical protein